MKDKKLTPDELTAKIIEHDIFWDGVEAVKKKGAYLLYTKKERIELIKEYARQKCKEQRELCAEGFLNTDDPVGHEILNSPKPQFD